MTRVARGLTVGRRRKWSRVAFDKRANNFRALSSSSSPSEAGGAPAPGACAAAQRAATCAMLQLHTSPPSFALAPAARAGRALRPQPGRRRLWPGRGSSEGALPRRPRTPAPCAGTTSPLPGARLSPAACQHARLPRRTRDSARDLPRGPARKVGRGGASVNDTRGCGGAALPGEGCRQRQWR